MLVVLAAGECRALPPAARVRVERLVDVVPLIRVGTAGVADGAAQRLRGLAERLRPVLAARRVHRDLRLSCDVEDRGEEAAVLQAFAHAVRTTCGCQKGFCISFWVLWLKHLNFLFYNCHFFFS